jgi:putative tricarboxylic transport membrane protein
MVELLCVFVLAIIIGVFAGTIPGINISSILLLSYPILLILNPPSIILFYIVVISITQYFGSVSATFFSVPGSLTAIPALKDAHTLFKNGDGDRAIMYAAIGSFLGSIFAISLTLLLLPHIAIFYTLFSTPIKAGIFLLAIILFIFNGGNSKFINFMLLVIGLGLGQVGYSYILQTSFMTFGFYQLLAGLPTIPVIIGVFIIPFLLFHLYNRPEFVTFEKINFSGYFYHSKNILYKWLIILKSSIVGYLSGFVPGTSYLFGTIVSYKLEKIASIKRKDKDIRINKLLAAETANNSGAFSQILPLLLVGIPITGSQAILYDLIFWGKGIILTIPYLQSIFLIIAVGYFFSSIFGLIFAGKYANYISVITKVNFKYLYILLIGLQVILIVYFGFMSFSTLLYLFTFIGSLVLGFLFYNYDKLPLIFGFLLSEPIFNSVYTLLHLI